MWASPAATARWGLLHEARTPNHLLCRSSRNHLPGLWTGHRQQPQAGNSISGKPVLPGHSHSTRSRRPCLVPTRPQGPPCTSPTWCLCWTSWKVGPEQLATCTGCWMSPPPSPSVKTEDRRGRRQPSHLPWDPPEPGILPHQPWPLQRPEAGSKRRSCPNPLTAP